MEKLIPLKDLPTKPKRKPLLEILNHYYAPLDPDVENNKKYWFTLILAKKIYTATGCITDHRLSFLENEVFYRVQKRFVSRSGWKLQQALKHWCMDISHLSFIDLGSSTGGFTDCLLQNNAEQVYAIDTGYNQLDYKLRIHPQVKVMEKTNIFQWQHHKPFVDAAVMDISFRSSVDLIEPLMNLTREKWVISLFKPQFERQNLPYLTQDNFNGIVPKEQIETIFQNYCLNLKKKNILVEKWIDCNMKGTHGNQESMCYLKKLM